MHVWRKKIEMIGIDVQSLDQNMDNNRFKLTLAERGREHLIKLGRFLECGNQIVLKHTKVNGKVRNHYTLRFSSKRITEKLIEIGEIWNMHKSTLF
jgi:hypothetical protein